VSDAGPLIAFARIGELDLLHRALGEICIPGAVYEELVVKGVGRPGARDIEESVWISRQLVEPERPQTNLTNLHPGELEAIALARSFGVRLLIDEHRGREAAIEQGIEVFGSLAVLAEAKRTGLIEQAGPLIEEMIRSGYWIEEDLVATFLVELGERSVQSP
jgi:predicted nucleic acid-binding protein